MCLYLLATFFHRDGFPLGFRPTTFFRYCLWELYLYDYNFRLTLIELYNIKTIQFCWNVCDASGSLIGMRLDLLLFYTGSLLLHRYLRLQSTKKCLNDSSFLLSLFVCDHKSIFVLFVPKHVRLIKGAVTSLIVHFSRWSSTAMSVSSLSWTLSGLEWI